MLEQSPSVVWTNPKAKLVATTPTDQSMFFGFHDISPWSPSGTQLLLLRLANDWQAMRDTVQQAEVCTWDPLSGTVEVIGTTDCWNFQQAARQQWLPGRGQELSYNRRDGQGACVAAIMDKSGTEKLVSGGLYAISADGTWAISPDFHILAARWPAYGYAWLAQETQSPDTEEVCIWRTDLLNGRRTKLVTLKQVLELWDGKSAATDHFLTHPSISPDGMQIVFLHRFFAEDGGSYTRLLCCDRVGSGLRVLADEKVSHFDWLDNETLLVWARFTGGGLAKMRAKGTLNSPLIRPLLNLVRRFTGRWKKRVLSESYFTLAIDDPSQRSRFGWPDLDSDGHPMVARSHDWIITDMYPDHKGELALILWHRRSNRRVDVARIRDGVLTDDSDAKCDLHPRWNRDETQVAVDYCSDGRRGVAIFDVTEIVNEAP